MKLQINSWQAVSTWTWNASDDTCGICRQALLEQEQRQGTPIRLLMGNVRGPVLETYSADSLLPLSFDSSFLRR
jgi:cytidine deaminase